MALESKQPDSHQQLDRHNVTLSNQSGDKPGLQRDLESVNDSNYPSSIGITYGLIGVIFFVLAMLGETELPKILKLGLATLFLVGQIIVVFWRLRVLDANYGATHRLTWIKFGIWVLFIASIVAFIPSFI